MAANFSLSFRSDTLRKHRRNILLEREKSLLPAMQIFVEYFKQMTFYDEEQVRIRLVYGNPAIRYRTPTDTEILYTVSWKYRTMAEKWRELIQLKAKLKLEMTELRTKRITSIKEAKTEKEVSEIVEKSHENLQVLFKERTMVKERMNEIREPYQTILDEYTKLSAEMNNAIRKAWDYRHLYNGETGVGTPERREFIMKCSDETCRGFLSSAYKCGTCEKWTCSQCLVVVGVEKDAPHTCNPDTVETAKTIKADTRPCPKCGTRIFKIDGCDQMWCVMDGCQTAFSWNTGHIVSGKVHNPHYYEWQRRNGGQAEREVGDIPCGGLPNINELFRATRSSDIPDKIKYTMYSIHRHLQELITMRLPEFPARPPNLINKDIDVQYLMNKISEDEWKRQMEFSEIKFQRKKEIGQILQTLATASSDIMNHIVNQSAVMESSVYAVWLSTMALEELERLRIFGNDSLKGLAKRDRIAVPQFEEEWVWKPLRAIYKPTKTTTVAVAEPVA